jgi:hypothetical protein
MSRPSKLAKASAVFVLLLGCSSESTGTIDTTSTSTGCPCADECEASGFAASGCAPETCQCDEPLDATCADGAAATCACLEQAGASCSDEDLLDLYVACYLNQEPDASLVLCFESFVDGDTVDCDAATSTCN